MKFQEAQILALVIQAKGVETEVIAMQARDNQGITFHYTAADYLDKANQLHNIADNIQDIAREGYLS